VPPAAQRKVVGRTQGPGDAKRGIRGGRRQKLRDEPGGHVQQRVRYISWTMYHLFVSGDADSWSGEPWTIAAKDSSRCLDEYTEPEISKQYRSFDPVAVGLLRRFPAIFAYEQGLHKDPHFGMVRDVAKRSGGVKVEYELLSLERFLTASELTAAAFDLDIADWELNRTHWALKKIDLAKELHPRGVVLPRWARSPYSKDISTHQFDVALSFPGEVRTFVKDVALELERMLGPDKYFYDDNYAAQLARPSLDLLLQDLYGARSQLVVVFLSSTYQESFWCGIEFRTIREIIHRRAHDRIMFVRMDDGEVQGVQSSDGYVDGRSHSPAEIARFIVERAKLQASKPASADI